MTHCVHCDTRPPSRPRGLCARCYHAPGVRNLYARVRDADYTRRGLGLSGTSQPPESPTDAAPGTEDKVRVLEERAASGRALWHPRDATRDG